MVVIYVIIDRQCPSQTVKFYIQSVDLYIYIIFIYLCNAWRSKQDTQAIVIRLMQCRFNNKIITKTENEELLYIIFISVFIYDILNVLNDYQYTRVQSNPIVNWMQLCLLLKCSEYFWRISFSCGQVINYNNPLQWKDVSSYLAKGLHFAICLEIYSRI